MKILLVGGMASRVGKTTVACRILEVLEGWGALKLSPVREHACSGGADCPHCHGMREDRELVFDDGSPPGTSTSRFRSAGAVRAAWLLAREEQLGQAIPDAVARFEDLPGLLVEGNSFARHLRPDAVVLVARVGHTEIKPSARTLLPIARWLVLNHAGEAPEHLRAARRDLGAAGVEGSVHLVAAAGSEDASLRALLEEIRVWARC